MDPATEPAEVRQGQGQRLSDQEYIQKLLGGSTRAGEVELELNGPDQLISELAIKEEVSKYLASPSLVTRSSLEEVELELDPQDQLISELAILRQAQQCAPGLLAGLGEVVQGWTSLRNNAQLLSTSWVIGATMAVTVVSNRFVPDLLPNQDSQPFPLNLIVWGFFFGYLLIGIVFPIMFYLFEKKKWASMSTIGLITRTSPTGGDDDSAGNDDHAIELATLSSVVRAYGLCREPPRSVVWFDHLCRGHQHRGLSYVHDCNGGWGNILSIDWEGLPGEHLVTEFHAAVTELLAVLPEEIAEREKMLG